MYIIIFKYEHCLDTVVGARQFILHARHGFICEYIMYIRYKKSDLVCGGTSRMPPNDADADAGRSININAT